MSKTFRPWGGERQASWQRERWIPESWHWNLDIQLQDVHHRYTSQGMLALLTVGDASLTVQPWS
jgi:hypothetical protein